MAEIGGTVDGQADVLPSLKGEFYTLGADAVTAPRRHGCATVGGYSNSAVSYLLYGLFALHVTGAHKHQWLDGEAELQRMLPGGR